MRQLSKTEGPETETEESLESGVRPAILRFENDGSEIIRNNAVVSDRESQACSENSGTAFGIKQLQREARP